MPLRSTRSVIALGAGITLLTLAGCTTAQDTTPDAADTSPSGGTLIYATGDSEPACLDPHVGGNYPQSLISSQVLEPLFGRDEAGTVTPWLAESAEVSDDGLTWTIALRDDITFTDGTSFNAEAVKVNIEHLQDPDTASSTGYLAVEQVEEIEIIDDANLLLRLSTPKSAMLEALSQPWTAMQSPAGIERGMEENCQAPIGTGPFVFGEWVPQQEVTLTRNDDYVATNPNVENEGAAHLDGIRWRFIPDAATRQAALTSGEVHVIDNPLPANIAQAEAQGLTHIDAPRPASSNRIELNTAQAPFDDIAVREAFVRAADPNPGIDSLFHGVTTRSYSPLSSVEPYTYGDESILATDAEAANELLDAAGWTERDADGTRLRDGERLTVQFPVSTDQSTAAEQSLFEQIQANTAAVGFDVQLTPLDIAGWYDAIGYRDGDLLDYNAVSAPYTVVGPDVLRILYHSSSTLPAPSGYFANHAMLEDATLDAVLDDAAAAPADERGALYEEAQRIVLNEFAILPLYDQQNHFLTGSVEDVKIIRTVSNPTFLDARLSD